jgi:hypothetical protein
LCSGSYFAILGLINPMSNIHTMPFQFSGRIFVKP